MRMTHQAVLSAEQLPHSGLRCSIALFAEACGESGPAAQSFFPVTVRKEAQYRARALPARRNIVLGPLRDGGYDGVG